MMEADSGLLNLLRQHLAWYPLMQARDAYKLIYQGSMGPEHMIATRQEFARRLEAEFAFLTPAPQDRLFEPVRQDQSLLRMNLRPYKALGQSMSRLVPLFLETSRLTHGSMVELVQSWVIFTKLCERGEAVPFELHEVQRFSQWLEEQGYPTVHHSQVYRHAYQPAYRLITAELATNLGLTHAG
jgi:hypothetical protein